MATAEQNYTSICDYIDEVIDEINLKTEEKSEKLEDYECFLTDIDGIADYLVKEFAKCQIKVYDRDLPLFKNMADKIIDVDSGVANENQFVYLPIIYKNYEFWLSVYIENARDDACSIIYGEYVIRLMERVEPPLTIDICHDYDYWTLELGADDMIWDRYEYENVFNRYDALTEMRKTLVDRKVEHETTCPYLVDEDIEYIELFDKGCYRDAGLIRVAS